MDSGWFQCITFIVHIIPIIITPVPAQIPDFEGPWSNTQLSISDIWESLQLFYSSNC